MTEITPELRAAAANLKAKLPNLIPALSKDIRIVLDSLPGEATRIEWKYDDGLAFALDVEKDQADGKWGFKSDSANGKGTHAYLSREAAIDLAHLILRTEGEEA